MSEEKLLKFSNVPIERKRPRLNSCKHKLLWIDEELRQVQCRSCETLLDPFQVLLDQASGYRQTDYRISELEKWEAKAAEANRKSRERRKKKENQ